MTARNLLAVLVLLPGTLSARQTDSLPRVTLAEARRLAIEIDPASVGSRAGVATAGWERRSAWADIVTPNLTAGATYTRFSEPFFNFGTGGISPNATSATFEARYSVLGTGKFAELRRARASLDGALADQMAANFRTALEADAAYYSVLAEAELSRVGAERLRRATEQLGVARVRVQAGEAIAADSLRLMVEVIRARFYVLQRDSALAVSRLRLGRRIGLPGPADAAPVDSAVPPALPLSLDAAVAELRATGPELASSRAAERRTAASLGIERAGYFPDISISATTGAYDSEFFPSATKRSQLAVTVAIPLWDAGRREVAVTRARGQRDVARADREDRERAAAATMAEAYNGYQTARAGVELALLNVAVSGENYRVQDARYREGASTTLDLLEAQVALSEAEATLVQSRYAIRLALARIEAQLGRRLFDAGN